MKPRIAIFGLPPASTGRLNIDVFANPVGNSPGDKIYRGCNDEHGQILDYVTADIEIGSTVTIVIMSSGICYYSHALRFNGADISHVPNFRKETNVAERHASSDWNLDLWRKWNPHKEHEDGLAVEKQYLMSKRISVAPVWESYYIDSNIDYFEKFQKLWIGLNAYATQRSTESQDKKRILALVESNLRQAFHEKLSQVVSQKSAEKWELLQRATEINMTSNIVRDEIAATCRSLDFLEQAKSARGTFSDISNQLDGLVFLDNEAGNDVFRNVFSRYHKFMASEDGIVEEFNLADAFSEPRTPRSVMRYGRLIFHDPFSNSAPGDLFSLQDYFGSEYANAPYLGQTDVQLRKWEAIDPLFFRYLHVLYIFRCAYFHGDLPLNQQNNELARTAYQSLHEIYPAIL